jgi:hypothetical protein
MDQDHSQNDARGSITPFFQKLNLKDQSTILVLDAPASFEPELAVLTGISIQREADRLEAMTCPKMRVVSDRRLPLE